MPTQEHAYANGFNYHSVVLKSPLTSSVPLSLVCSQSSFSLDSLAAIWILSDPPLNWFILNLSDCTHFIKKKYFTFIDVYSLALVGYSIFCTISGGKVSYAMGVR